jgi:hypothetical protein
MLIHCTKKVCERLKITPPEASVEFDPLYSWRLNVIEEGRRRLVVFMNDASRYVVAIDGVKYNDWAKLPKLIEKNLRDVMLDEQINPEIVDLYISNAGNIEYVKNTDKQMTAWINKACENVCIAYRNHDTNVAISRFVNHYLVGTKSEKDYWQPNERFYEKLYSFGLPLKRFRAFKLAVRLATLGNWVRRELLVPANITFNQLHNIIDKAYCWWDYKTQFNFMFYKTGSPNEAPDFILYEERDPSSFPDNAKPMTDVKLSDYLPEYRAFKYFYDYVAEWQHYIELTEIVKDCTDELPLLLSGEGDAPPDKVGGVEGFADFLDKIKNGKYAERQEKQRWGKYYGYEPFAFETVNKKVKDALKF